MIFFLIFCFKKIINFETFNNLNLFLFLTFSLFSSSVVKSKEVKELIYKKSNVSKQEATNKNQTKTNQGVKISNIKWHLLNKSFNDNQEIIWRNTTEKEYKESITIPKNKKKIISISSFNRSIVFNDNIIGPDISWIVPPGFKWNTKYKYDFSIRGHNRRNTSKNFQTIRDMHLAENNYYISMAIQILVEIFISQYLKPGGNMILMETFRFIQLQQV